ncbi:MAG TPA: nucleotidyltransferase family protein [Ignavibacteriales bacterium]|nr:nucleotidyltransferase family protein [Ignavibacteriales bacterium]
MNLHELRQKRDRILQIASLYGARDLRIFGSIARNEQTESSDVDILAKMEKGTTLLRHISLVHALEEELGIKVDVVSENAIKGRIKENIMREVIQL